MLESADLKNKFLQSKRVQLGKSRRYSVLKDNSELDGLNGILFAMENELSLKLKGDEVLFKKNRNDYMWKLYDISELSERLFSINVSRFLSFNGLNIDDFCSFLKLSPARSKLLLGRGKSLPLSACLKLVELTKTPLPLWFSPDVDMKSLVDNWSAANGQKMSLPDKFLVGGGSKIRTFESAVRFVDEKLGPKFSNEILGRMQIFRDIFGFPDKSISLNIFKKFHILVRKYGMDDDFFIEMGAYNTMVNKLSRIDFQQRFSPQSSRDVLRDLGVYISPRVDVNYFYETHKNTKEKIVIYSAPRESMLKSMGNKVFGTYEIALYRFGHILDMPKFYDFNSACFKKSYLDYNEDTDEAYFHCYL